MKDKHNVILVLVSSSKINFCLPEWFIISHSRLEMCYLSFRSPKFHFISSQTFIQSLQGFTLCFQLLLPFDWSSFCYRISSWRLYMIVHQGFISFSKCSSRFFSEEPKLFLILHSRVQFFLPYHWRWYYVILDNLSSCFMIHMLLTMRYIKSINLSIGIILDYISPKAFPKDCC